MKTIFSFILILIFNNLIAQEIVEREITTEVNEVTVFIDGAQIVSKKSLELSKGLHLLKFVNLSPFIDSKSIQIKSIGEIMVLSVNHQQNFSDKISKSKDLIALEDSYKSILEQITIENTHLGIIKDELAFLQDNRLIGGKQEELSYSNFELLYDYYGNKLTSLKLKEVDINKKVIELNQQKTDLQNQLKNFFNLRSYPKGEIWVKVEAKKSGLASFDLSYIVGNAGWFPSYEIRAKSINDPVQIVYKANVKQDTKVDWKNVKLRFSSSQPTISGVAPELKTYFLDYNLMSPNYQTQINSVSGKVTDTKSQPLPGVSVIVQGTTIGAITDMEGNYSISIPSNASYLDFSFIGMDAQTLPITNKVMNVVLTESDMDVDEVVVTGYGSGDGIQPLLGKVSGVGISNDKSEIRIRGMKSSPMPVAQIEKQTAVDFEIEIPYTIKSDSKNYTVEMLTYDIPASYQYFCVPKINKDAFLIANIIDWEQYNFLEGEANIFFEDTYIGKSLLDVRYVTDTLEISLGRDKKVSVSREKINDFSTRQFLGSKMEETRAWRTTVKNNKAEPINLMILDQVPVSTNQEIEVTVKNNSGATYKNDSGEMKWQQMLNPGESKILDLIYSVKYPKNRYLNIE